MKKRLINQWRKKELRASKSRRKSRKWGI